jgi:hypothetical protein
MNTASKQAVHLQAIIAGRDRLPMTTDDQRPTSPDAAPRDSAAGSSKVAYADEDDLVEALAEERHSSHGTRNVVFMLGSGLCMPPRPRARGVPGTEGFVRAINRILQPAERDRLEIELESSRQRYQTAFSFLSRSRSHDVANRVIRQQVLQARTAPPSDAELPQVTAAEQAACRRYEADVDGWELPQGVEQLGALIQDGLSRIVKSRLRPGPGDARFSRLHLTTNFDPLLAVSIQRAGGMSDAAVLASDGPLPGSNPGVCKIVHLHGRWSEGDTLHNDLDMPRPLLEASLRTLLQENTLAVIGYGGWDDVFMKTLRNVAQSNAQLDILWTFYENDIAQIETTYEKQIHTLKQLVGPRIKFYRGVDTNRLFAKLRARVNPTRQDPPASGAKWLWVIGAVAALSVGAAALSSVFPPDPEPPAETSSSASVVHPTAEAETHFEACALDAQQGDPPLPKRMTFRGQPVELLPCSAKPAALAGGTPGREAPNDIELKDPFYDASALLDAPQPASRRLPRNTAPLDAPQPAPPRLLLCKKDHFEWTATVTRHCAAIKEVRAHAKDAAPAIGRSQDGGCTHRLLLPSAWFGKELRVSFMPLHYAAQKRQFTSASVAIDPGAKRCESCARTLKRDEEDCRGNTVCLRRVAHTSHACERPCRP